MRANQTWCYWEDSERLKIPFPEETLTDLNLLEIERAHPGVLSVKKFDKPTEGKTGVDWEWWIGDARTNRWCKIWVQAKRLESGQQKYPRVNYKQKGRPKSQLEMLRDEAQNNKATPLYCFYNNWAVANPAALCDCKTCVAIGVPTPFMQHGCTVASAEYIYTLPSRTRGRLQVVRDGTLPWHHLICLCTPPPQGKDLIDALTSLLLGSLKVPKGRIYVHNGLPAYVGIILSSQIQITPNDRVAIRSLDPEDDEIVLPANEVQRSTDAEYVLVTLIGDDQG